MHELSIAEAIVAIAERHAAGRRVYRVSVKVGHLRQVVPDALQFAFQLLTDGTVLEGAELAIEEVPARVRCRGCGRGRTRASSRCRAGSAGAWTWRCVPARSSSSTSWMWKKH